MRLVTAPAIAISLMIAMLLGSRAALGADRDALLKAQREQRQAQMNQMEQQVASLPVLGSKSLDEVFRLNLHGANLELVSPLLEPSRLNTRGRITRDPFTGPTSVTITQMGAAIGRRGMFGAAALNPQTNRSFALLSYKMVNPDDLEIIMVQDWGMRLMLTRQVQVGTGGYKLVQLTQQQNDPALAPNGRPVVQLTINEFGNDVQAHNSTITAPDFQTMMREHPAEADQFIRPLFRSIGQDAALAPDDHVAWQVLSGHWQLDPSLAARVREMLPALNDADFHVRDRALSELDSMGMPGAAVLLHLDRVNLTPEQNLMIDRTLAPFEQLSAKDADRLRGNVQFLLDCLYVGDRDVRAAALDQLRQVTGKDLAFNVDGQESDRSAAVSALRKQLTANPTTEPGKS